MDCQRSNSIPSKSRKYQGKVCFEICLAVNAAGKNSSSSHSRTGERGTGPGAGWNATGLLDQPARRAPLPLDIFEISKKFGRTAESDAVIFVQNIVSYRNAHKPLRIQPPLDMPFL